MAWPSPKRWRAGCRSSAPRTGAIAELVGDDAGIVVPPGDVSALANALSRVLGDAEADRVREKLAEGARRVRQELPTWDDAANRMDALLSRVAG